MVSEEVDVFNNGSCWWKDLGIMKRSWFEEGCKRVIRCGREVSFWHGVWAGEEKLKDVYGRLFMK